MKCVKTSALVCPPWPSRQLPTFTLCFPKFWARTSKLLVKTLAWFCLAPPGVPIGLMTPQEFPPAGVKQQIVEGLGTQMAACKEAIRELEHTHPEGGAAAFKLLERVFHFSFDLLNLLNTMWSECLGRSGEVGEKEVWVVICAVVCQLFREFCGV